MSALKLYIDHISQPCRSVLALCLLKNIGIEVVQVRLNKQQNRTQHYKKVNPTMKVPALQDSYNNISFGESHTIMRYLSRKFQKTRQQLYPVWDLNKVTKIDQYLDYHHLEVRSKLTSYMFNTVIKSLRDSFSEQYDLPAGKQAVKTSLTQLNQYFLKDKYIIGDQMTIADLSAFYEVNFLTLIDFNFQKYPKIYQWLKRMEQNSEINEANKIFLKLREKMKQNMSERNKAIFQIV